MDQRVHFATGGGDKKECDVSCPKHFTWRALAGAPRYKHGHRLCYGSVCAYIRR